MSDLQIPFKIKSIATTEFATIKNFHKNGDEIGISTGFNFGVNHESHTVAVLFDLAFESNKIPFVILKIIMEFDVIPAAFKKFKNKNSKNITIPKEFLTHLAALTVSTARGILHTKLEGTELNYLLLPALNVSDIITKDIEFKS
jgi:uncharacterized protein with PQ loop repeat